MLQNGAIDAQTYSLEPGKILFVTTGPGQVNRIKEFVLSQPETDWFEFQQRRSFPEGRSEPLMDNEARKEREIELGWKKPTPPKADPKKEKKRDKKRKARRRRGATHEEL